MRHLPVALLALAACTPKIGDTAAEETGAPGPDTEDTDDTHDTVDTDDTHDTVDTEDTAPPDTSPLKEVSFTELSAYQADVDVIALADLDADGRDDIVEVNGDFLWWRPGGVETARVLGTTRVDLALLVADALGETPSSAPFLSWRVAQVGQIDDTPGDDLVFDVQVLLEDGYACGTVVFTDDTPRVLAADADFLACPASEVLGDVDGDGLEDIAVLYPDRTDVHTAAGIMSAATVGGHIPYYAHAHMVDSDGDGWLDLVSLIDGGFGIYAMERYAGTDSGLADAVLSDGFDAYGALTGDNAGPWGPATEVMFFNSTTETLQWMGEGQPDFVDVIPVEGWVWHAGFGELDGRPGLDVLGTEGDVVRAWIGNGAGAAVELPVTDATAAYGAFLIGDVDGDGLDDLVTTDPTMSPQGVHVWRNTSRD